MHRYADALEHAASDDLIELIAAKLGNPVEDPHGDPIPNRLLEVDERSHPALADLAAGAEGRIVRVSDSDPEMLRYLSELGVGIGDRVVLLGRQPFEGPYDVRIGERQLALGAPVARAIRVAPLP